jgi:lipoprotein-anchoring transpeptidase ErfK/SrfK
MFTIHNKIRNPDWYNRGETVPHGDPRNPLGASWMGFAKDGTPLSYGIHPTNDLGAIGQPAGRGCVRLKPEHAEALFRLCPVGTTVTIR